MTVGAIGTDFRLLGPLEVVLNGEQLDVGHRRQRLLLGVLLLEAGRPVRFDRLIELAWSGEDPPRTARNALQVGVSKLRATLGGAAEIVTSGESYRVEIAPDLVDAHRFRALVQQAGRTKGQQAIELYQKALGLWRGPILAGTFDEELRQLLCGGLIEERLRAIEERIDQELELGLHGRVISELTDLIRTNPTRERPVGQLMLALYRSGRQADALKVYRDTRRRLVDELGIEPSQELESLHRRVLNGDPGLAAPSVTVQAPALRRFLPRDVPDFTGRARDLRRLDEMALDPAATSHTMIISAIAGVGGVGKTALAVHWAHRAASRFPDGQLYLNLRGYDARHPLPSDEATRMLLRALGIPRDAIPHDTDEAAGLYRSTVADKKLLVLLDNARSAEQVRPLLPASPGSLVLITSRDSLAGLIARDGASRLVLDMMLPEDAVNLLITMLGHNRVAAEPEAAGDLAKLCGYLPLALRVAAANLAGLPGASIAAYVKELAGSDRIASLAVDGDPESSVRAVFEHSYRQLPQVQRRLFRLLGLIPGNDFTAAVAGALAQLPAADTDAALRALIEAHLITEHRPGRYTMHDLIRDYSAGLAGAPEHEGERVQSISRLMRWIRGHVESAVSCLYPNGLALPDGGQPGEPLFVNPSDAMTWLDTELSNLVATVESAGALGHPDMAWRIPFACRSFFFLRSGRPTMIAMAQAGLDAAKQAEDAWGRAASELVMAQAYNLAGHDDRSLLHAQRCLREARSIPWPEMQIDALNAMSVHYMHVGDLSRSAECARESYETCVALGRPAAQYLGKLGLVNLLMGALADAAACFERTLAHKDHQAKTSRAITLLNLGDTYRLLGRRLEAEESLIQAVRTFEELDSPAIAAVAQVTLAILYSEWGRHDEAREQAELARAVLEEGIDELAKAQMWHACGVVAAGCGDFHAATEALDRAARAAELLRLTHPATQVMVTAAEVRRRMSKLDDALSLGTSALRAARKGQFRVLEGQAMNAIAYASRDAGNREEALAAARAAHEIHEATGHRPGAEAAKALLRDLEA